MNNTVIDFNTNDSETNILRVSGEYYENDTIRCHIEGFTIRNTTDINQNVTAIYIDGGHLHYMYKDEINITIQNCDIYNCYNGIILSNNDTPTSLIKIKNNIIRDIVYTGIRSYANYTYILNNTITRINGSAVKSGDYTFMKNNVVTANNIGLDRGSGWSTFFNSFNNVFNNTINYANGATSGPGDISLDPQLVSSTDFSLLNTSPCIDSGDPDTDGDGISWITDIDDQDPDGTRKDIGASYYAQGPIVNPYSGVSIPTFNCLSYNWSSGQTQSTITVSPNQTTTYTLTVTDGDFSSTDSVVVNVNPLPNIDLGPNILQNCNNDSVILDPGSGYANYQWVDIFRGGWEYEDDTVFLSNNQTFTFYGMPDTISLFVTDSVGCSEVIVSLFLIYLLL